LITVGEVIGQFIAGENRLANRKHFKGERSQFLICHYGIKLIAYHLKNGIEFGEMQALKKYVVGYFVALLNSVSRMKSTLVGIGSPRRTLFNELLVVCFFGEAGV